MDNTTSDPEEFTSNLVKVLTEKPDVSTREVFTKHLIDVPVPSWAHKDWARYCRQHQVLLEKLAQHPAMVPNLQQTYSTPANDKNNVYFMWDFVGRTLESRYAPEGLLFRTDPEMPDGISKGMMDVVTRTVMASTLIINESKPGMLDEMTESLYPEQRGKHPRFGDEIVQLARDMETDKNPGQPA